MSNLRRRRAFPLGLSAIALASFALPALAQTSPCTQVTDGTAEIAIDRDAAADPDCLEIPKRKVDVVWTATGDVTQLLVTWKLVDAKKPLDDPDCSGTTCTFEKLKAKKDGEYQYAITVTRADGSTVTVDPKLIIKN